MRGPGTASEPQRTTHESKVCRGEGLATHGRPESAILSLCLRFQARGEIGGSGLSEAPKLRHHLAIPARRRQDHARNVIGETFCRS
jgi:hypothetical protein